MLVTDLYGRIWGVENPLSDPLNVSGLPFRTTPDVVQRLQGHLDFLDRDVDHRRWRAEREQSRRRQVEELTEIVERLIGIGAHAEINIAIKRAHRVGHTHSRYDRSVGARIEWEEQKDCCAKPILLAGSHDIGDFVQRVTRTKHSEWADAIGKLSNQLGGQF